MLFGPDSQIMNVLYVTGAFPKASETFIAHQIQGIQARGIPVSVLAFHAEPVINDELWPRDLLDKVIYARPTPPGKLNRLLDLCAYLSKGNASLQSPGLFARALMDRNSCYHTYYSLAASLPSLSPNTIVHAEFGQWGRLLAVLKKFGLFDAPIVTSFRGGDSTIFLKTNPHGYRELYEVGAYFLPVSEKLRGLHVAHGCLPDKIGVLRSGLNCNGWPIQKAGRKAEPARFVGVGRLVEKKGFQYAIEALARLRAGGLEAELVLVGEGLLESSLRTLAEQKGLGEFVRFTGWLNRTGLQEILHGATALVAPSVRAANGDEEGIPNVVKEAMLMRVPVIATRHGGIPELVRDGETGLLVSEADPASLAEAMRDLLLEPKKADHLVEKAELLVHEEYDIGKLTDQLVKVYESSLA